MRWAPCGSRRHALLLAPLVELEDRQGRQAEQDRQDRVQALAPAEVVDRHRDPDHGEHDSQPRPPPSPSRSRHDLGVRRPPAEVLRSAEVAEGQRPAECRQRQPVAHVAVGDGGPHVGNRHPRPPARTRSSPSDRPRALRPTRGTGGTPCRPRRCSGSTTPTPATAPEATPSPRAPHEHPLRSASRPRRPFPPGSPNPTCR